MEPLSSFAISLAAGIALDIYNKSQGDVKKELKDAFNLAMKLWCKNDDIRDYKRNEIKNQLTALLNDSEHLPAIKTNNQELNSFLNKYSESLAGYPSAFNYIKEIKDLERFKKELYLLEGINNTVLDTNKKLTEFLQNSKTKISKKKVKTISKIQKNRRHGVKVIIFGKQLDKLKNSKDYQNAIELIINNFPTYPSWELLIEFLKFCELDSNPSYGINFFQKNRQLLDTNPNDDQKEQKEALNYYLGRLYTQIGNYQEAFSWHRNNTEDRITSYFQLLSRFEIASLHFRTENFLLAIEGYEKITISFKYIDHSIFIRIHVFLYLATAYVIRVIYNVPNSNYHKMINPNAQKSIDYSNKALKLISNLNFEDDRYDKLAWTYLTLAFGEESRGDFKKSHDYYIKSEELILAGKTNNSSIAHIFIYISRYYRRNKQYQKALEKIKLIRKLLPTNSRLKIESSLYEEVSYILSEYGKQKLSKLFFKQAILLFKNEPSIEIKLHWPIVERLARSCKELDIEFDKSLTI